MIHHGRGAALDGSKIERRRLPQMDLLCVYDVDEYNGHGHSFDSAPGVLLSQARDRPHILTVRTGAMTPLRRSSSGMRAAGCVRGDFAACLRG